MRKEGNPDSWLAEQKAEHASRLPALLRLEQAISILALVVAPVSEILAYHCSCHIYSNSHECKH